MRLFGYRIIKEIEYAKQLDSVYQSGIDCAESKYPSISQEATEHGYMGSLIAFCLELDKLLELPRRSRKLKTGVGNLKLKYENQLKTLKEVK